jgi:hypothetical protein
MGPVVSSGYPSVDSNDNQLGSFTYKIAARDDFDDTSNLEIKTCYKDSDGKETCLDSSYVPFTIDSDGVYINENYKITVPTNDGQAYYDGQVYTIYSYIKDTAGNTTVSDSVTYSLKENQSPIIQDATVSNSESSDSDTEFNSKTAYIHFVVSDEDDYVYACVSENSSTCTNYSSTLFDGSSLDTYTVTYTNNNWTYDGSKKTLYLFIKDRKGRIVTSSGLSYTLYKECDKTNSEDTNASYTAVNSNDKISASKCSGKCYYWDTVYSTDENGYYLDKNKSIVYKVDADGNLLNTSGKVVYTVDSDGNYLDSSKKVVDKSVVFKDVDVILAESDTAGISAKYKRTISYADKFIKDTTGSSTYCLQVKDQVYEEHCDFVDCFYNPKKSSYVSKAIGITEVTTSNIYYTYEYNGKVYSTNKYYKLYSSSYNDGDEYITLDLTGYKLLPSLVDDATGPFTYNSSSDDPYLRVLDDDTPFSGEVTLIEESNS